MGIEGIVAKNEGYKEGYADGLAEGAAKCAAGPWRPIEKLITIPEPGVDHLRLLLTQGLGMHSDLIHKGIRGDWSAEMAGAIESYRYHGYTHFAVVGALPLRPKGEV